MKVPLLTIEALLFDALIVIFGKLEFIAKWESALSIESCPVDRVSDREESLSEVKGITNLQI